MSSWVDLETWMGRVLDVVCSGLLDVWRAFVSVLICSLQSVALVSEDEDRVYDPPKM